MIKINFNKTKTGNELTAHTQSTGMASVGSTLITNLKKKITGAELEVEPVVIVKIIINISLILACPLGLKIYEINQINTLKKEKVKLESVLNERQQTLNQLKNQLKDYTHIKAKAKEFADKKKFLKELAEIRLFIPRTIDLIQNKVPDNVWLENLKLEVLKGSNRLEISGKSFNESYVNFFASSLHDIMDENTITVNTRDIKEGDSVVKVNFVLKGLL